MVNSDLVCLGDVGECGTSTLAVSTEILPFFKVFANTTLPGSDLFVKDRKCTLSPLILVISQA